MTLTIRPRHDEDLPELAAALVRVHAKDGYPVEGVADPEGWLRHPNELQSWTAIEDARPIGQITLTRAEPGDDAAHAWQERTGGGIEQVAIPARLFVDPDHRGTGAFVEPDRGMVLEHDVERDGESAGLRELHCGFHQEPARPGTQRVADLTHRYGDGLTEPAAVYVVPS